MNQPCMLVGVEKSRGPVARLDALCLTSAYLIYLETVDILVKGQKVCDKLSQMSRK